MESTENPSPPTNNPIPQEPSITTLTAKIPPPAPALPAVPPRLTPKRHYKAWGIMALLLIIVGLIGWYFLYHIKTPVYSLNLAREAAQKHDLVQFNKHVDLDSILSQGFDDLVSAAIESDPHMKPADINFISNFAKIVKTPVNSLLKQSILFYVENGQWESSDTTSTRNHTASSADKELLPELTLPKISKDAGLDNSRFEKIAYTKIDGDTATVGLILTDQKSQKETLFDIKMRKLPDGTWQAIAISNLKQFALDWQKEKAKSPQTPPPSEKLSN